MLSGTIFTADGCANCPPMKKTLEEFSDIFTFNVLNVSNNEKNMAMARHWNIQGVPTTLVFKDGEQAHMFVGNHPKSEVGEILEGLIQRDILQESSGGEPDTSSALLCDSSEQKDSGTNSN